MGMPMPTTDTTAMPVPMPMATDPMVPILMATDPMLPTPTTPLARGPLMPSPLLMLMPTTDPTTAMPPVPMPTAMLDTDLLMPMVPTPTLMATTPLARGLLMLSPLLMLMLTTDPTTVMPVPMLMDTDHMALIPMATDPMVLDTTDTRKPAIPTKIPTEFQKSATTSENDLKFPFLFV